MPHAVCLLSVVPVRSEPGDRYEMVTQLLFGDLVEITEFNGGWTHVKVLYDGYTGWIDAKQCSILDPVTFEALQREEVHLVSELVAEITHHSTQRIRVVAGTMLPGLDKDTFTISGSIYRYKGASLKWGEQCTRESVLRFAEMYMDTPYAWGGKTPFGLDCSGFTQMVYRLAGIALKRDARQQAMQGKPLAFLSEALPGDLAFFDDTEGNIIHVGIISGPDSIIHSSGQVRTDSLDHQGIYNRQKNAYTHTLRLIRQVF